MIIEDRKKLAEEIDKLKAKGKRIVFTNGCFDLLHKGHVVYLDQAKNFGDVLVVGINNDDSVREFKGPQRPIMPLESRTCVINALKSVDIVVPFGERLPNELIKIIRPHIHVKGGDYRPQDLPEYELVTSFGGEVKIVPLVEGFSVTSIIERILKNSKY